MQDNAKKVTFDVKKFKERELDLHLRNWEMCKDRIKFSDEIIARLRLEGTPIGFGVYTLGAIAKIWGIFVLGIIYIIGIFLLDILHLNLLNKSVSKAKEIEEKIGNYAYLNITHHLTSRFRTILHYLGMGILYGSLTIAGTIFNFSSNE